MNGVCKSRNARVGESLDGILRDARSVLTLQE